MNGPPAEKIYLDYNASTPIDPQVAAVMSHAPGNAFGNPSSPHWAGAPAHARVTEARQQVARLLGCSENEIVFTSGGSEANNLALKGLFFAQRNLGAHMVTTQIEHPAIVEPCRFLQRLGAQVTWLPVDRTGRIDPGQLRAAIRPETILISVMHANNEVGTIQPIEECARIARQSGVPFHTDAAQSVGKIPARVDDLGVDLLSIAGHKLYAPKGIGALYVRDGIELEPLIHGAGHERGRRAGTESALLAAALGTACEMAGDASEMQRIRALRDRLWAGLQQAFEHRVVLNGHPHERLPNTLNVSFIGHVGSDILGNLPEIAASTGSACHSGSVKLSPVLEAMQVPPEVGAGAIRFSLGRGTRPEEIDLVIERLSSQLSS